MPAPRVVRTVWQPVCVAAVVAVVVVVTVTLVDRNPGHHAPAGAYQPTTSASSPHGIMSAPTDEPQLDVVANALGQLGRGSFADVYGDLIVQTDRDQVLVYVTDLSRGRRLLDEADRRLPQTDRGHAVLASCPYTERALDREVGIVMQRPIAQRWQISSAGVQTDATGIFVTSSRHDAHWLAAMKAALQKMVHVPVTVGYAEVEPLVGHV